MYFFASSISRGATGEMRAARERSYSWPIVNSLLLLIIHLIHVIIILSITIFGDEAVAPVIKTLTVEAKVGQLPCW
jgi:hypothetical protein